MIQKEREILKVPLKDKKSDQQETAHQQLQWI